MDIESKQNLISTGSIIVLYVLGLSIGLQQPVYEFFELKDYLEVTPVWLLPTAIYILFAGFVSLFLPVPIISIRDARDPEPVWKELISSGIILLLPLLLLMVLHLLGVILNNDFIYVLITVHLTALLGSAVAFLVLYEKRLVGLEPEQKWLRFVLMTNIIALFVALSVGYYGGPRWVRFSRESTVIVDNKGDTKDQEIHGNIVLHLERYLLLQDKSNHLVAISTSQIKRIDSPPFPTPSPTPDPNSLN